MSLLLPELNAYGQTVSYLALKAHRLKERSRSAANPHRRAMLDRMSRACMAYGLAKSHFEHGSDKGPSLIEAAVEHLRVARATVSG